jgi:hypothetical protein
MSGFGMGFLDPLQRMKRFRDVPPEENDMFEPYDPPMEEDIGPSMETEDVGEFSPDETLTVRPSAAQQSTMGLEDWLGRRPQRAQYEPSVGRKILAGFAGFLTGLQNPAQGAAVARGIKGNKYQEALEDWRTEGKAIGEVGELGQKMAETERKGAANKMTYDSAMEGIKQRRDAEAQRHKDRLSAATTDQEKAAEVVRHNKAQEASAKEQNAIDTRFAGAREKTAEAYAGRMNKLNERGQRVKSSDMDEAFWSSVEELITEMMPEAESAVIRDPKTQQIIGWAPNLKLENEEMHSKAFGTNKFQILKDQAMKRARKKLQGLELDEEPGDIPLDFELPGAGVPRRQRIP